MNKPKRIRHTETIQRYKFCSDGGKARAAHRVIWEQANGQKIPKGYDIHHKDGNGHNNDPSNLVLLSHSEHAKLHCAMRRNGTDPVDGSDPIIARAREQGRAYAKRHRIEHGDEIRSKQREYRAEHREEHREAGRKYYATHKAERRAYHEAHKEEIAVRMHQYRIDNREKLIARDKARYAENKEAILAKSKEYYDKHQPDIVKQKHEYHEKNKDVINAKCRQRRLENHDLYLQRDRERFERTKELRYARSQLRQAIKTGKPQEWIDKKREAVETIHARLVAEGKIQPKYGHS